MELKDLNTLMNDKITELNVDPAINDVINFFSHATGSDFDNFIAKSNEDFFNDIRSHALALKINRDGYLDELKKDKKTYHDYVNGIHLGPLYSLLLALDFYRNDNCWNA